jgi:hypothetical protein
MTENVSCPMCGKTLLLTDKPWRLTAHTPPKKLEPRDCVCGVEAWVRRSPAGVLFVAMFQPNQPFKVRVVRS